MAESLRPGMRTAEIDRLVREDTARRGGRPSQLDFQGQGLGSAVLAALLKECDAVGAVVRLTVLRQSPARRLYERHGFAFEREDDLEVALVRPRG